MTSAFSKEKCYDYSTLKSTVYISDGQIRVTKCYQLEMPGIATVKLKNFRISVFNKYLVFQVQQ